MNRTTYYCSLRHAVKLLILSWLFTSATVYAQNVFIEHQVQRYVGGVSLLDRSKFFNLHSNSRDTELNQFYNDYNVSPSRGFWGPFSYSKGQGNAIGTYPSGKNGTDEVKAVSRFVGTEHPYNVFKDGLDPIAAGNWAAEYYKDYVDASGRPEFFEPMNEPFVHAKDYYSGGWNLAEENRIKLQMAEVYAAIGNKIHATPALANMKVIGYSAAWPSLEIGDFGHWEENMKMFMDVAGADMDGFSTHLYDGVNVTGQDNRRSGSNSEAILDLIETYSYTKWGKVKPHSITEYGAIASGYGDNYTDIESIQTVKGINQMLFNLLDRENNIDISIPFITDKSTWHLTPGNNYQPYGAALLIPTNIGQPTVAGWKYSPKIHFYEQWKNVSGRRVHVYSDNPDIQIQGFANNNMLYVALNNLDDQSQNVNLNFLSGLSGLQNVTTKSLKIYPNSNPVMNISSSASAPSSINLIGGETVVLELRFANSIPFNNAIRDRKYYTSKHLQAINANTAITFNFNGIATGTGQAVLLMGIGRKHNKSKQPTIKVNGTTVTVPNNWKGYDQANRDDFFGVIEIPFDHSLVQTNNTVTVTFPDGGGHVSSMILKTKTFDQAVAPTESVAIVSPTSTIGSDTTIPITLSYSAGQQRDIVAEFWSSTGWLGQATKTINAGSGSETLSISLGSAPAIGSGYIVKASIRPVGTNWQQNIATDQKNNLSVTAPQSAYGGTPHSIPGKVEAEDYDIGGQGIAFSDTDTNNQGGMYRTDGVDIEICSDTDGGYNVGWMNTGEWLEYTVNVNITDDYDFFPRVASINDGGVLKISVDGVAVTGNLTVPNTGGWQAYQTMHIRNVPLTQGQHVVRIDVVNSGFNLNLWAAWQSATSNARQVNTTLEEQKEVSIYPIPSANDKLYIVVPNSELTTIEVFNLEGKRLVQDQFEGDKYTLPVENLPEGMYIINISNAHVQTTKKVIIK
ncbi:carbohydrate-binding protein [Flammeovirga sp. MY04]|uniref:carbohydrate-binding protein n=1 Tax=Flammeovirga sp. MY04 TaxID=1191459 RepID=UPI000806201D|nr:carbohydrate-binding protein [Flammeovirga sp. MY04]ANQ51878.1 carbohydrate-binding protein [Flammeovirga sp. MY04]